MHKTLLLLISLICITHSHIYSNTENQKYYFKHLGSEQGLSQSSVLCIIQDRNGFMWFGTKDGLNRYDGLSFKVFEHDYNNPNSLGNNVINSIYEMSDGCIWIGTDAGIYIYDPKLENFSKFLTLSKNGVGVHQPVYQISQDKAGDIWIAVESQGMFCYKPDKKILLNYPVRITNSINSFCIDSQERIWISTKNKGLYYTDDKFNKLNLFVDENGNNTFLDDHIFKILPDNHNHLYIGSSSGGLKRINIISKKVTDILPANKQQGNIFVRNILKYSDNELWIATESGIYIYNSLDQTYQHINHNINNKYSLSDNAVYSIFKDNEDGIWIGSYFGGIDYYPSQKTFFDKYFPVCGQNSLSGRIVREFCEDNKGNIWIGTEDGGLNKFNPQTRQFTQFTDEQLYYNIHALCLDGDFLWIGTYSNGLHRLNLMTNELRHYYSEHSEKTLNDNNIYSMYKTSSGDIFIGTTSGLNIYNRGEDNFTRVEKLDGIFVYNILEDYNGNLWFATYNSGIYKYNPRTKEWKNYISYPNNPESLPYNKVISIFEDSRNQLWFTMQGGGFCSFDSESETFTRYNSSGGVANDVIYKIIEDKKGIFWLTSNRGLIKFDPVKKTFKTFTTDNGLLNDQFNYSSGMLLKNGNIYFGGINGFISFDPESFKENDYFPPVVITDFFLFNEKAEINKAASPLKESISFIKNLDLKHNQNSFSFRFSALSYLAPENNNLSYKLEGFDKEWYSLTDNNTATYTNLKPGKYVFSVRSSNNIGEWNKDTTSIEIEIHPPFWQSTIAYFLYIILSGGLVFYLAHLFHKRIIDKQKRELEVLETEKEKEIYNAKIDFFTNIAHEIRTPLTLIKGPLEHILKKQEVSNDVKENLDVMEQNTLRLLDLTNQLLDFRKTETKGFSLNFMDYNISEIIRETYTRFLPTARQNNLKFDLNLSEDDFYAPVDKEALTKILSNLFNNAIKYARSYSIVTLGTKDDTYFSISVNNDGELIPMNMKEEIFKPFTQIKNTENGHRAAGTGIGLPLARSLAELHKGSLDLENSDDICFTLKLPLKQENVIHIKKKEDDYTNHPPSIISKNNSTDCIILVVEDDPTMLKFVSKQLNESYTVITANNGIEALNILETETINLIVSDVMMPGMDGFELCRKLKSDLSFSHIPIVLLTAKATLQSKIEGIELGADAYVEKPFSTEYLLVRIANLLSNQEKLRRTFTSSPFVEAKTIALSKADESFLEKLTEVIQKNLVETDFNVDVLASEMNMSRSSLHRKIKGISELTPNEFIQLERLKTAAQLIKSGNYRINEVCYIVGFSSSSYFAKCFQKQFGVLPKDFK